jgi:hypothetical protein
LWRSASADVQPVESFDLGGQPGASVRLRRIRPNSSSKDRPFAKGMRNQPCVPIATKMHSQVGEDCHNAQYAKCLRSIPF